MAERVDYELTDAEAALLAAATEDAAAGAGALGGSIGGAISGRVGGGALARRAGAAGGRWGAKRTKAQTAQTTVEVPLWPEAARGAQRAAAALMADGALIDDPNAANDGSIWGFVGSGAMNMSPASSASRSTPGSRAVRR
ncbi:MAG: hypothetical protein M3396_00800 [Actinomycetota bacterium]|nr:hypothetical protein [Actinomycetota bacterium]